LALRLSEGLGIAVPAHHNRNFESLGLRWSTVERCSSFSEAINATRQCNTRLRRARPDVRRHFDVVGLVEAATRDCSKFWPPTKRKADRSGTGRAEVNKDVLSTSVRLVPVLTNLTMVEFHRID